MSSTYTKMYLVSESEYKKLGKHASPTHTQKVTKPAAAAVSKPRKISKKLSLDEEMAITGLKRVQEKNKYKRRLPILFKRYR